MFTCMWHSSLGFTYTNNIFINTFFCVFGCLTLTLTAFRSHNFWKKRHWRRDHNCRARHNTMATLNQVQYVLWTIGLMACSQHRMFSSSHYLSIRINPLLLSGLPLLSLKDEMYQLYRFLRGFRHVLPSCGFVNSLWLFSGVAVWIWYFIKWRNVLSDLHQTKMLYIHILGCM